MKSTKILVAVLVMSSILSTATKSFAVDAFAVMQVVEAFIKGAKKEKPRELPDTSWLTEESANVPVVPEQPKESEQLEEKDAKIEQRVLTPEQQADLCEAKKKVQQMLMERAKKLQASSQQKN